jgi:hypothetical protein
MKSVLQSGRLHWREHNTIFCLFPMLCVYRTISGNWLFQFLTLKYETGFHLWDTCGIMLIAVGLGKLSENISKLQTK